MSTQTLEVVVRHREVQGAGVVVLELEPAVGVLPPFEAGAHVDVHVGADLVRQYSLCGDPGDASRYRLGVLRDLASRGGSQTVHDRLHEGARVTISAPRNHFPLSRDAHHSILVGGGIGVTPILAMAYELQTAGRSFEMHYCTRSRASSAFLEEIEGSAFAQKVHLHFDDAGEAARLNVPALVEAAGTSGTHLYVCGPSGFMDWVIGSAEAAGLGGSQIHREYFNAMVDTSGKSFEVVAAVSGKSVHVQEGQTIVAALASIGVKVDVSCEEGVCGTCLCMVLEGECDHRDVYLTEEERAANDQIMVCCSRAKSPRLVLDI